MEIIKTVLGFLFDWAVQKEIYLTLDPILDPYYLDYRSVIVEFIGNLFKDLVMRIKGVVSSVNEGISVEESAMKSDDDSSSIFEMTAGESNVVSVLYHALFIEIFI